MTITDHRLDGVRFDRLSDQGALFPRRFLVIHFTEGASGASSIHSMREDGISAHLVIERDGTVIQCVPFDRRAKHAGASKWKDPKTGVEYIGNNAHAIGIELANAGSAQIKWAREQPGFSSIRAKHRNGGPEKEWEVFPEAQLAACFEVSKLIVSTYNLDDVTGHDCIAPARKEDPGPAFPMEKLREFCGFKGLPSVHR